MLMDIFKKYEHDITAEKINFKTCLSESEDVYKSGNWVLTDLFIKHLDNLYSITDDMILSTSDTIKDKINKFNEDIKISNIDIDNIRYPSYEHKNICSDLKTHMYITTDVIKELCSTRCSHDYSFTQIYDKMMSDLQYILMKVCNNEIEYIHLSEDSSDDEIEKSIEYIIFCRYLYRKMMNNVFDETKYTIGSLTLKNDKTVDRILNLIYFLMIIITTWYKRVLISYDDVIQ